jgi:hypothetical protein
VISDTDWQLLDERLKSIEDSIQLLQILFPQIKPPESLDDIERSIVVIQAWIDTQIHNKYYPSKPADLTKATRPYGALGEIPCVFDNMPESEKMKSLCISCNCPRCPPYALSMGSLTDAGLKQQWRNKDD